MSEGPYSLIAFQRADDLYITLHGVSQTFPAIERYELASQLRRAAFSVPANIAESTGRRFNKDKLRFLEYSLSSLIESGYCLHAAKRLRYLAESEHAALDREVRRVAKPLRGLMDSLGREVF